MYLICFDKAQGIICEGFVTCLLQICAFQVSVGCDMVWCLSIHLSSKHVNYIVPVGTKSVSPYQVYDISAKLVLMAHVVHKVQTGGKQTINNIALETDMYMTAICFFGGVTAQPSIFLNLIPPKKA